LQLLQDWIPALARMIESELEDEVDDSSSWTRSWRRMVTGDENTRVRDYLNESVFMKQTPSDHAVDIWVACANGSTLEFTAHESDTIEKVRSKVCELSGIPTQEQRLYDSGQRVLTGDMTVREISELNSSNNISITVEEGPLGINVGPSNNPLFRVMCCRLIDGGNVHKMSGESLLPEMVLTHINGESQMRMPFNDVKIKLKETRPVELTFAQAEEAIPRWCAELQLLRVEPSALTMLSWQVKNSRVEVTEAGTIATVAASESSWNLVTTGTEMTNGRHYWEVQLLKGSTVYIGVARPGLDLNAQHAEKESTSAWFVGAHWGDPFGAGEWAPSVASVLHLYLYWLVSFQSLCT
jgi:hypothetical protein